MRNSIRSDRPIHPGDPAPRIFASAGLFDFDTLDTDAVFSSLEGWEGAATDLDGWNP